MPSALSGGLAPADPPSPLGAQFWRHIHDRARTVQGRLNDIGMLCASAAERHDAGPSKGQYTEEARAMLESLGRYVRLFHMLMFASLTSRFAVLRTPRGMGELVRRGAMTQPEYEALLQTSMGHHAVIEWISTLLNSALGDGRLCGSASGGSSGALQITLQAKLTELRAQYGGIEDQLTGRMPLAYTQLVQIMVRRPCSIGAAGWAGPPGRATSITRPSLPRGRPPPPPPPGHPTHRRL